eukprot:3940765-Rhodomonas_salina.1
MSPCGGVTVGGSSMIATTLLQVCASVWLVQDAMKKSSMKPTPSTDRLPYSRQSGTSVPARSVVTLARKKAQRR